MKEGDVVQIVGKLDDRISDAGTDLVFGTIIQYTKEQVAVLLSNGNLWHGPSYEVILQKQEVTNEEG